MVSAKKAFWYGLITWLLYMAARSAVKYALPATDHQAYFRQDLGITFFRLCCILSCSLIYARTWGRTVLLGGSRTTGLLWSCGSLLVLSELFNWLRFDIRTLDFDAFEVVIVLVVAFNEEIGFRGLFQSALTEMKGERWAEWVGSLMFALMHAGYAPFYRMPFIFLWGLAAAKMRSRGASLSFLVLIHWLSDIGWGVFVTGAKIHPGFHWVDLALLLAALSVLWLTGPAPAAKRLEAAS